MSKRTADEKAPAPHAPFVGQRMRRRNDGQLGFVVERAEDEGGGLGIQLDRKAEKIVFPYSDQLWAVDEGSRLTPSHIARIAYAADRELRQARGEYGTKEYATLPEKERMGWLHSIPPGADAERVKLYAAVRGALG